MWPFKKRISKEEYEKLLLSVKPNKKVNLPWAEFQLDPNALKHLNKINNDPELKRKIIDFLYKFKATEFKYINGGFTTSVFSISEGLVLKIVFTSEDINSFPNFVIKPYEVLSYKGLVVMICPKVKTSGITKNDRLTVIKEAQNEGFEIVDGKDDNDNYGILPNGKPKWLDIGGYKKIK